MPGTQQLEQGTLTEGESLVQLTSFVLTSLDQLLLILHILFAFFTKQAGYLNEVNRKCFLARASVQTILRGSSMLGLSIKVNKFDIFFSTKHLKLNWSVLGDQLYRH
jgi:hypothetical protein